MKFTLARRSAFGNEKPRNIAPFTTANIVVTPQMPSASTRIARLEKDRSFRKTRKPMRRSWAKVSGCILGLRLDGGAGPDVHRLSNRRDDALRRLPDANIAAVTRPVLTT